MLIFRLTAIFFLLSFVSGCFFSKAEKNQDPNKIILSQAELDLMLEKARAEGRASADDETTKQEDRKKVYDKILMSQGKQPRFTTLVNPQTQPRSTKQNSDSPQAPQPKAAESTLRKIIPDNRKPQFYRTVEGIQLYRCAANSMTPIVSSEGEVQYSAQNEELSATLCKKSRTKNIIKRLQERLYELGFLKEKGLSEAQLKDGVWGNTTLYAVRDYQKENALLWGQLTIQTLEHIRVFPAPQTVEAYLTSEQNAQSVGGTKNLDQKTTGLIKNIINIRPESNEPVFYRKEGGATYMRCAAKTLTPLKKEEGSWKYSPNHQILTAILCKDSRDKATMTDLQYELYEKGYMPDEGMPIGQLISGEWDNRTLEAVMRYQKTNGLLFGELTIETLEYLGIFKPDEQRIKNQDEQNPSKQTAQVKPAVEEVQMPAIQKIDLEQSQAEMENEAKEAIVLNKRDPSSKSEEGKAPVVLQETVVSTPQEVADITRQEEKAEIVPFQALEVRLADPNLNAATFEPKTAERQVYAYINKYT